MASIFLEEKLVMICLAHCLYSPQWESLNPQFVGSAPTPVPSEGRYITCLSACLPGHLAHLQKARLLFGLGEMSFSPG